MLWPSDDDQECTEPNAEPQDENNSSVSACENQPKARRDDTDFSDPVFKKLSRLNGEVNRMTKEELKDKLTSLRLDPKGVKDILKRRLKNYYKKQNLQKAHIKAPGSTRYDYLLVIDYEATCMENNTNYKHEIIEFPCVLIDVQQVKIVDEFHCYCKPRLNRRLTQFCTQLTGITQDKVDAADEFPAVLSKFEDWMSSHHLHDYYKCAIVTDGPWDMSRFLFTQCQLSNLAYPRWARKWINVRKLYANYYQCRRCRIEEMLSRLGMHFEGSLHCGIDDARNIARITMHMLRDGCAFKLNEFIHISQDRASKKLEAEVDTVEDKTLTDDKALTDGCGDGKGDCGEGKGGHGDGKGVPGPGGQVNGVVGRSVSADVIASQSTSSSLDSDSGQLITAVDLSESQESVEDLIHYYKLQSL